MVMTDQGNTSKAKLYYTRDKKRMEMVDKDTAGEAIIIMRLDKKVVWTLMPSEKTYMEMALAEGNKNPLADEPDNIIKRAKMGRETVEGHPTIKEKVTVKAQGGSTDTFYYWMATDLEVPIKAEALDGSWSYIYKDIKVAKQAAALFEVPKAYKKMQGFAVPDGDETGGGDEEEYPEPYYPEPPGYPEPPAPYVPGVPGPPIPW
ncbi:MAG TPA: DUF4412 domain-containing protein, partial [Nitrospirota bacterium]|nr:DUF4412 domain-containing protein [Nitrospirota bacterium]